MAEYALKIGTTPSLTEVQVQETIKFVLMEFSISFVLEMEIITPIRDLKLSREAEIQYLTEKDFSGDYTKSVYSINQGLLELRLAEKKRHFS